MDKAVSLLAELGLTHLTRDVRLRLVHELIDTLAERSDRSADTPPKLRHELRQRLDECDGAPDALVSWQLLKRQLHEARND